MKKKLKKSLRVLREEYKKLKHNKVNTKKLMIELMKTSNVDFCVDRMNQKLHKAGGWQDTEGEIYKYFDQLCYSLELVYCGNKSDFIGDRCIGSHPVFSLPASMKN